MSGRYEKIGGSSARSSHSCEYRLVEFFFALYTLGILYILCSGLINFKIPSGDAITIYGIDKVSGFYGPGSWAAWLLTTMACCIDRLFHQPRQVNRPRKSILSLKSGIDLNLIAVYSYPIIAGVDLLRRSRHDFSDEASSSDIGCIAASLTVLRMGAGLGTLLAGLYARRREIHQTPLLPVLLSITASLTLFIMSVTFDFILIDFRAQDFALNLFGLPGHEFQLEPSGTGLGALLKKSKLIDEEARLPLLALYFTGGDMAIVPRTMLSIILLFIAANSLMMYEPSWRLVPRILGTVFVVYLGVAVLLTMSTFFGVFFCIHFWFVTDIPITMARLGDLDQLSVLCLSGVLILVTTLVDVVPGYGKLKRGWLSWKAFGRRWLGLELRHEMQREHEPILE
ncbi:hypothetical protein DL98DRAFT_515787 [Cadophora sp. DSE1049]|nr:hypothetical protein DL98DRAFT_515787 [Cadophora sp. DSE1049]